MERISVNRIELRVNQCPLKLIISFLWYSITRIDLACLFNILIGLIMNGFCLDAYKTWQCSFFFCFVFVFVFVFFFSSFTQILNFRNKTNLKANASFCSNWTKYIILFGYVWFKEFVFKFIYVVYIVYMLTTGLLDWFMLDANTPPPAANPRSDQNTNTGSFELWVL